MNRKLKKTLIESLIILFTLNLSILTQTQSEIESHRVSLPNGWKLTPVEKTLPLRDLPLNITLTPSKKLATIISNGQSDQTIQLVDIEREIILDSVVIGKSWLYLTFSNNEKYLYVSG